MDINLVTNLSKDYTNVKITIEAPEMNEDIKMMVDIIESFSNSKKNLISYSDGKNIFYQQMIYSIFIVKVKRIIAKLKIAYIK